MCRENERNVQGEWKECGEKVGRMEGTWREGRENGRNVGMKGKNRRKED